MESVVKKYWTVPIFPILFSDLPEESRKENEKSNSDENEDIDEVPDENDKIRSTFRRFQVMFLSQQVSKDLKKGLQTI